MASEASGEAAGVLPGIGLLALTGLALSLVAVLRWSPDAAFRLTPEERLLAQAERHARELDHRPEVAGNVQVTAGPRILATLNGLEPLVRHHADPELRRQLIERAPPLRLGVRFWRAVAPNGTTGALLLEYDCDARLVGASFGFDDMMQRGLPPARREYFADQLAGLLVGDPVPMREETGLGGPIELIYRRGPDMPSAYVYLGDDGRWMAELQPIPNLIMTRFSSSVVDRIPLFQALVWTTGILVVLAVGVLLWRLTRRRAGFGQAPLVVLILLAGLLPVLGEWRGSGGLLAVVWLYYLITQVGVVLAWTVGEAELREARPAALEHWDRLAGRRPLAETGRQLMLGVLFGTILAGGLAASGEMVTQWGGGYRALLVILPDYWTLAGPVNQGVALAATVAFLVGLGGRLGRLFGLVTAKRLSVRRGLTVRTATKIGAVLGALLAGLAWALVTPVAPLRWSLLIGCLLGLASAWIAWFCGLLTLAVACVTTLAVPTAIVSWSAPQYLLAVALVASLPMPVFVLGLVLWRRAPQQGDFRAVLPSYVSDREQEARLQAEVELLRNLQLSLLPPVDGSGLPGVEIAWRMIPADVVGGDFLDVIEDEAGRLWLAVADVAGHGISCSVLTAFTKAAVAEHATAGIGPAQALERIRRLFGRLHPSRRTLVTLLLAVWDPPRRELRVATAGHPPLVLWDEKGARELGLGSHPLGVELGGEDREQTVRCPGRAVLVACTDGVGEATSPNDDAFGYDRWQRQVGEIADRPADVMLDELLASLERHRGGRPAADDVTAVVLKLADRHGSARV